VRLYLDAAGGLLRRDWMTFTSYRTQLFSLIIGLLTNLALFYFMSRLVRVAAFPTPESYFAFAVVGMVIVQVLQSTLGVATALRGELLTGTFERLLLSPFGAVAGVASMMLFPFVVSLLSAFLLLALATIVFGVPIQWSTAGLAVPISILGTGTFASFGMLFAAVTIVFKRAVGGLGLLLTAITLTSGLYFPVALLPGYLQWLSSVQPFTPAVNLLRNVLVGTPLEDSAWVEVARIAGFLVVLVPLSVIALQAGIRLAQKRGTIIEY
jgi:ABC-type polysaccharide/polyol phosphate export permease